MSLSGGRLAWARPARFLPWAVVALSVALVVGYAALGFSRPPSIRALPGPFPIPTIGDVVGELPFLVLGAVGAVIAVRQPRNRLGWLLMVPGLFSALANFDTEYALRAVAPHHGPLVGGSVALWLAYWIWMPAGFAAPLSLLLLPNGHFLSRRWRRVGGITLLALMVGALAGALGPTAASIPRGLHNPLGIEALPWLGALPSLYGPVLGVLVALAFVSLGLRYRRGGVTERLQLKWVLFASIGAPISFVMSAVATPSFSSAHPGFALVNAVVNQAGVIAIAIGLGVAILKYRLYDIDVVISRTLVYSTLAVLITAVYVGIVSGLGGLVSGGRSPNLLLSIVATGVVAIAFQPVRERVQRVANRLVYGSRATPYEVLSSLSSRVAESYAREEVLTRMAQALCEGTGAEVAAVWLRHEDRLSVAATWPAAEGPDGAAVEVTDEELPALPAGGRAVAVRQAGALLGALSVRKRGDESLTPAEQKLLDDLAGQAALVLRNVRLAADLQARLVDLRASRQRLVSAQDQERRRLERNLHDGAQQNLVALRVKLGMAHTFAGRDPGRSQELIRQLRADADDALETVRDLARGIYPPLLAERGLVAALEAQARKASVPVEVRGDGLARYPQEVEAGLYFCCLEALQNLEKYASASRATIRLIHSEGMLSVEVVDDGRGFDPRTTTRGAGLQNMGDRLAALSGRVEVHSAPGEGTRIAASVPVGAGGAGDTPGAPVELDHERMSDRRCVESGR